MLYMRKNGEPVVECMSIADLKTKPIALPAGTVELFPGANQVCNVCVCAFVFVCVCVRARVCVFCTYRAFVDQFMSAHRFHLTFRNFTRARFGCVLHRAPNLKSITIVTLQPRS